MDSDDKIGAALGCAALVLVIGVLGVIFSLRIVSAGEIGVAVSGGKVDLEERGPGFNFVMPFVSDVVSMDGRVQAVTFEKLAAASKEYQDVFLTGTLNIHVQFDKAAELYQNVGPDYVSKIVVPYYTNIVKEIVPQFSISEILPKRELIRSLTVTKLQEKLTQYGIIVDDVALANVDFNENYNAAIQDKQVQELRVQTEQNILAQKQIQKQQLIVQAQADAQAQIERAKGESEANRLISQSLTTEILQNRYIEKLASNIQVMVLPNSGNFLFDINGAITKQVPAQ